MYIYLKDIILITLVQFKNTILFSIIDDKQNVATNLEGLPGIESQVSAELSSFSLFSAVQASSYPAIGASPNEAAEVTSLGYRTLEPRRGTKCEGKRYLKWIP